MKKFINEIKKFVADTMKPNGKYEVKRALGIWSFNVTVLYILAPLCDPKFVVLEFVVWGLLAYSAGCLAIALQEKIKMFSKDSFKETTTSETIITNTKDE